MKNKFGLIVFSILALSGLLYTGCYSDQFEPEPIIIDPIDTISFGNEILPILVTDCAVSICHGSGANVPDLTPANAYNSLNNGGYVDTSDPVKSSLYLSLTGSGGQELMPPIGRNNELIELILGWMQQGALNN